MFSIFILLFLLPLAVADEVDCLAGWSLYKGHCYKHFYNFTDRVDFNNAQERCKRHGGYLAQPNDWFELYFIFLISRFEYSATIDFNEIPLIGVVKQNGWKYAVPDGSTGAPYLNWCHAPNNAEGRENCVEFRLTWSTNGPCYRDAFCDAGYTSYNSNGLKGFSRYICETVPPFCTNPDTVKVDGKCVCKEDFIDITATDVPERRKYKPGEKCFPKQPCNHIRDSLTVMFLIDSSESIQQKNWKSLVEFLRMAADQLPLTANVGFIKFSEEVTFAKILPGGWMKKEFQDFVPTEYDNGMTNTPAALDKAREMLSGSVTHIELNKLFQTDYSRNKIVVLITDGLPVMEKTEGNKTEALRLTKEAAEKLHDENIPLVALGYGPQLEYEGANIRKWLQDDEDYFSYDKLACDLKSSHMSILMQKVCRRFL